MRFWKPRRLHAEDMQLILRRIDNMTAALDRLTASIGNLTAEDDKLLGILTALAGEMRNSADDSAAINALADKVDAEVAKVQGGESAAHPPAPPFAPPPPADQTGSPDTPPADPAA